MVQGAFPKKEVMIQMLSAFSAAAENYVLVISDTVIAILLTNVSGEILMFKSKPDEKIIHFNLSLNLIKLYE